MGPQHEDELQQQQPASPLEEGLPQALPGDEARASLDMSRHASQEPHRTSLAIGRARSQSTHRASLDAPPPAQPEPEGQ